MINVNTEFLIFRNVLSPKECLRTVDFYLKNGIKSSNKVVSLDTKTNKMRSTEADYQTRKVENYFYTSQKLIDKVSEVAGAAIGSTWGAEIDCVEPLQLSVYNKGGHYSWHRDQLPMPFQASEPIKMKGKVRKISFSLSLNPSSEYDGGEFEIERYDNNPRLPSTVIIDELKVVGTLLVFPSLSIHRVKEISRGTRYSLVGWLCGPPWK